MELDDVRRFVREAHGTQTDKLGRNDDEAHLEPIALALRAHGPEAEMAGLLHDVIEYTTTAELKARYERARAPLLASGEEHR